ncbi:MULTISPECIES: hypothetical protein [unclassified Corynebacterium]|uniref:hypothetical protein n=1 Tax=unclassified Corynebacterium TaxID=2624378 RepID=UPI0029CA918F|nr:MULTISPECIES: hypothetical protein [unclassified Corynebacterium]WPF65227.1 hypothetical protein OLX12_06455 [Corynebacterium sp. 22KM0430]WPF67722.1 hypothetical protein OLW90_06445 [Corynebacterium sp. 21KM1197]
MVSFPHAISSAWWWPLPEVTALLASAGFRVEHTERRQDSGARPHAALIARRPGSAIHSSENSL